MPAPKGKTPWIKGKHHSKISKEKISEAMKGKNKGKKYPNRKKPLPFSEGHKRKISEGGKGKRKPPLSEEAKRKLREWQINNPNRKFKDTSIELKIEIELLRRNINYQKQVPLCRVAIVDFYLPEYRIVIQCDGDYWHNLPGRKERDERQDKVLTFNGFNVYRFWEHEINKSTKNCIDKLKL